MKLPNTAGVFFFLLTFLGMIGLLVYAVTDRMQCEDQIYVYGSVSNCVMNYTCAGKNYSLLIPKQCYADNYRLRVSRKSCEQKECDEVGIVLAALAVALTGTLFCCLFVGICLIPCFESRSLPHQPLLQPPPALPSYLEKSPIADKKVPPVELPPSYYELAGSSEV
jgi:hypothetical protein